MTGQETLAENGRTKRLERKATSQLNEEEKEAYLKLEKKVKKMIFWRNFFQWGDFSLAHTFVWVSVLASFASSIIIATETIKFPPWQVAIIAGIPGLVIIIEKTFNFTKRSVWGTMYSLELEELKNEIDYKTEEPYELARKLTIIKRRNELRFIRIGFFSQQKEANKPEGQKHSQGN